MKKIILLSFVVIAQICFAQREYKFDYHSVYDISQSTPPQPPKEISVYDNSSDSGYQLVIYPESARIHDDARNEIHYFKTVPAADSLQFEYEYSLKVLFNNEMELSNIKVKKLSDRDYELTYLKKTSKNQTREKMEFCLMEHEQDLLNTTYSESGMKESRLLMSHLRKSLDKNQNYRVEEALHTTGRYQTLYRRKTIQPVEFSITLPAAIHYKNSFLKN